jgi:hypothetical protein
VSPAQRSQIEFRERGISCFVLTILIELRDKSISGAGSDCAAQYIEGKVRLAFLLNGTKAEC